MTKMISAQAMLQREAGAHPTIGLKAKRSCTDCWCLLVFALMWAAMIAVAVIAFSRGDPLRLIYGTDYLGNICGEGDAPAAYNISNAEWSSRKQLWYPITFDPIGRRMFITEAIDLGICVADCPRRRDISVSTYIPRADGAANATAPVSYPILFDSALTMYRCLPEFLTFDCANATDCLNSLKGAAEQFSLVNDALLLGQAGMREVIDGWWVILVGILSSVVWSFLWVFTLRRTVKPIVVIFILLALGLLATGGALCFLQMKAIKDDPQAGGSNADAWLAGAIVLWVIAFVCVCVLVFVGRSIMIACDIIEEAAKVPISIPSMNTVPIAIFAATLPFAAFLVAVCIFIQSCGETLTIDGYRPVYNSSIDFSDVAALMQNTSAISQYYEATTFSFEGWRVYAQLYNIFIFLWTYGLLNAVGYLVFSLCCVFWYWSNPGDDKKPPLGSVCIALSMALRYHLGSLALGAFLVAVVQLMRIILIFISKQAKEKGAEEQPQLKFLMRCLMCLLACLERLIKFVNKNAYNVMAHDGECFFTSARIGVELFTSNVLIVGMASAIAELFFFFGKFQIALFSGGVAFLLTYFVEEAGGGPSRGIILIFIVAVVAYLVASLFLSVLSTCVECLTVCFCYDKQYSDVDYFPEDLAKHVDVRVDDALARQKASALASAQMADSNGGHLPPPIPMSDKISSGWGPNDNARDRGRLAQPMLPNSDSAHGFTDL